MRWTLGGLLRLRERGDGDCVANLELQPGERVIAQAKAQLARGFPQTAGDLVLTDSRLVLVPNQFASLGLGKRWQVAIADIVEIQQLGRFEGGTLVGSAGKKLGIRTSDGSLHTLAFYLGADLGSFNSAIEAQMSDANDH